MNPAHKPDEQKLLDQFLAAWSDRSQIARIEQRESPDFEGVLVTGQRLGLEMVTVTDSTLAKGRSDIHDRFVPELQAACRTRLVGATFSVNFEEWDAQRLADKEHRRNLVERVADFARDARDHRQKIYRSTLEARGIEGLDSLSFYAEKVGDVGVMVGRTAHGRGCNEIQACIAAKDAKAADYRRRLGHDAALWLLVVAGTSFADGVEPPPRHLTFDTVFDRIFFLDHWPVRHGEPLDRVVELPIRSRDAGPPT